MVVNIRVPTHSVIEADVQVVPESPHHNRMSHHPHSVSNLIKNIITSVMLALVSVVSQHPVKFSYLLVRVISLGSLVWKGQIHEVHQIIISSIQRIEIIIRLNDLMRNVQ